VSSPAGTRAATNSGNLRLSVVVPARNAAETIGEQLDALLARRQKDFEVIVVDNCSQDGTADIARRFAKLDDRVRVIEANEGSGVSYVRNRGIEAAVCDSIAICDSDDVVSPQWVEVMSDALQTHSLVTGPLNVRDLNPDWIAESRGLATEKSAPTFHNSFPYAHGCNLGLRRELWEALGGFDESALSCEDMHFGLRAHLLGRSAVFEPRAVVLYRYRTQARQLFGQGRSYGNWRPFIFRCAKDAGLTVPSRAAGWRSWLWLIGHLPSVISAGGRSRWCWVAGNRLGQVEGSVRHRTLFL
jgi:glycosyltransferase involved in cell wall biosynthesis